VTRVSHQYSRRCTTRHLRQILCNHLDRCEERIDNIIWLAPLLFTVGNFRAASPLAITVPNARPILNGGAYALDN